MNRVHSPLPAAVALAAFIFVALFGFPLLMLAGMHTEHHGCPLMATQLLCSMGVLEHAKLWQGMLAALLGEIALLLAAAVFFRRMRDGVLVHTPLRAPRSPSFSEILFPFSAALLLGTTLNPRAP